MKQPGEITNARGGMLEVTFCRPDACAKCGACEGGKKEHKIWVRGEGETGDIAVVEMPDGLVARASAIAYGLPLFGLLAGMVAGNLLCGGGNAGTLIGGAAGLAISLIALKMTEKKRAARDEWQPKVVEVIARGGEGTENVDE